MKSIILYEYPPDPGGLSMQGDMLHRGLLENGEGSMPCHWQGGLQKEWIFETFKPDICVGVGCWDFVPDIVYHPQKFGVIPVPWLVADGWVANYHKELSDLPLVLVTSQWVKDTYKRDGVDVKNFEVVPVGLEPKIFRPISKKDPKVKKIRELLGIRPDEKVIMTVGGDATSKGAQEIMRALALIGDKFTNWRYVCKGWDSDCASHHQSEIDELMDELKLDRKKFVFVNHTFSHEFMPYFLNICDIYAAPSRLEGFGMIQTEAMACGVPVISIDAMGPKETIIHGETGYLAKVAETVDLESELVYPHMGFEKEKRIYFDKPKTFAYRADVDELAEYLLTLFTNDKKRQEMGRKAAIHAVDKFDYNKVAKLVADLAKQKLNLK